MPYSECLQINEIELNEASGDPTPGPPSSGRRQTSGQYKILIITGANY